MPNKEADLLRAIAGDFPRHPHQLNKLLEADAEIIGLPGRQHEYLVLKTDGLHEEIKTKLYEDPYLLGWMTVTAPVSDIAAVGAIPAGLLLSLVLDQEADSEWLGQFTSGIRAACDKYHIYVLGGDTNFDSSCSVSATVVANIYAGRPLQRTGIRKGDFLYATGLLGLGNAYAYSRFFDSSLEVTYFPTARLDACAFTQAYATACMDTSDGLFPALGVLADVNATGFKLLLPLEEILHPAALSVCRQAGVPAWMLLAGPHGEYELLFSVPPDNQPLFEQACAAANWKAVLLAEATGDAEISFLLDAKRVACATNTIPDLYYEAKGSISAYYSLLQEQHGRWDH